MHKFNDPVNREIECASASGIGSAEGLAKVYGIIANGGKTTDGKRLLSETLIKELNGGGSPWIIDEILGIPTKFSSGFFRMTYQNREVFGHPGAGGNNAYADFKYHLGVGYVTRYGSQFGIGNDPRFTPLRDAVYQAIQKLER